jgi:hypothetical protein
VSVYFLKTYIDPTYRSRHEEENCSPIENGRYDVVIGYSCSHVLEKARVYIAKDITS